MVDESSVPLVGRGRQLRNDEDGFAPRREKGEVLSA